MTNPIIYSIIIPFKSWSKELDECLVHIQKLSYSMFEVILLPDEEVVLPSFSFSLEIIPTGPINPAQKRDIGAKKSRGNLPCIY